MLKNQLLIPLFLIAILSCAGGNASAYQTDTAIEQHAQSAERASSVGMKTDTPQAAEIKASIVRLMNAAKNGEIEFLNEIYHDQMRIYMIDGDNAVVEMDKPKFISHLKKAIAMGQGVNTWAKFHKISANERYGNVLISRKVNLTGTEKKITLSINFIHEDGRWQITRETIFTGALPEASATERAGDGDLKPMQAVNVAQRKTLEQFNERFNQIVSKYDEQSFLELYEKKSWLIAPGKRPAEGPTELSKMISFLSANNYRMQHTIDRMLVSDDGSQAIIIGEAKATNSDSPLQAIGTYLFVLNQNEGQWKIDIDMFNQYQPVQPQDKN